MTDEVDYIGVMTYYNKSGFHVTPDMVTGRKILATKITGQALTANTWTDACTSANAVSSNNGQLETGHRYAVAWTLFYSATGIAFKLSHADWSGNMPGGMVGTTIYHKKNFTDFSERGTLPVFSSSSPLTPKVFDSGTATPVMVIGLIDVTDLAPLPGVEDFNLAYGTTTNGTTTFTKFTVAGGDTLYIKNEMSHGNCYLRGAMMTGTAPLRGQIRSTDLSFQPNPIELPYGFTTVAGDYLQKVLFPLPPVKENSLIDCYGTS